MWRDMYSILQSAIESENITADNNNMQYRYRIIGVSLIRPYSCNTRILPYPVVSCRILPYPAVSCRILPYHAVSCRILPYPAVYCRILLSLPYPAVCQ